MKRSKHSLSNTKLLSCDMGELVPMGLTEVLPGDTVQQATSMLLRCAPMFAPVMHPVQVNCHHFFVPTRICWDNWQDFITGGPDGNDASEHPTITMDETVATQGSLADYYGVVPLNPGNDSITVNAVPFRGFAKIYNEFFRDQDLQAELPVSTDDGDDTITNTDLMRVNWQKDYFTASRPWEQKGDQITIPIGDRAPITSSGSEGDTLQLQDENGDTFLMDATDSNLKIGGPGGITDFYADLSDVTGISVNELREYLALQRYQEARARYGSRYIEYLRYLGVRSSDARLQRPEYLGGGSSTIQFSEVLQTAEGTDPVGELKGHGIAGMRSNRYRRFFEEHGYIHSFVSVRPTSIYNQALHKTWLRRQKEDYWQKELQFIGQQAVLNEEIYPLHDEPDGVFGYQDRYDDYRRVPSTVSGEFRDTTLNYWHLARDFAAEPALNSDFITCNPSERIFAAPTKDVLYIQARHSIQARRLVVKTGTSRTF